MHIASKCIKLNVIMKEIILINKRYSNQTKVISVINYIQEPKNCNKLHYLSESTHALPKSAPQYPGWPVWPHIWPVWPYWLPYWANWCWILAQLPIFLLSIVLKPVQIHYYAQQHHSIYVLLYAILYTAL